MRALYKAPEHDKFHEIIIPNELGVMQQLVGGYIETVTIAEDAVVICNEEGKLLDLPYNCEYEGIMYNGPILIVGTAGDEFTDAPMSVMVANGGIES